MTSRLRRKHRTTVRDQIQLASRVNRTQIVVGRFVVFSVVALGLVTQWAGAQTGRTFNPPVHVPVGQQKHATQKYRGIATPQNHVPEFSIVGSLPEPMSHRTQRVSQQPSRRSPQLQSRIAQALNGIAGRTRQNSRAQEPTINQNIPRRRPTPFGSGVAADRLPPAQGEQRTRQQVSYDAQQRRNAPRRQFATPPPVDQQSPQNFAASQQPNPRREMRPNYPVQPIQNGTVMMAESQYAQPIESSDTYYNRSDVQMTSAQEFDTEIMIEEEPELRVAQAPMQSGFQGQQSTQAAPVSVLNSSQPSPSDSSSPYYQDVDRREVSLPVDPMIQENDVYPVQGGEQAEDVPSTEDDDDEIQRPSFDQTCDEIRTALLNSSITEIALDISPPKSGNAPTVEPQVRTWTDQFGRVLGTGSIDSIRRGFVVINTVNGLQKLPYGNLSDPDLAVVAEYWHIPKACTVSTDVFSGRSWVPQTLTWKASNLCHKPLFFENVQLERYGHSHGPFSQPVHSAVHFFKSLVLYNYNSGITPPNECRYALGYYRPGNCAPWLVDPFPISLAGAKHQAQAMVGGAFLITP